LGSVSLSDEADLRFAGARSDIPEQLVDVLDNRPEKAFRPLPQETPVYGSVSLDNLDGVDKTGQYLLHIYSGGDVEFWASSIHLRTNATEIPSLEQQLSRLRSTSLSQTLLVV
jgi:hypothetical protein